VKSPPTLLTLIAAALALGLAGLLPAVICLLVMVLIGLVGVMVPHRYPGITETAWGRTTVAAGALGLIVLATAATGPQNLVTGHADDPLGSAADVLAVPTGVPLGLLAALAAGSLIAVTLELGSRRGVQSGLVLGTAVLGLACVAAPSGQRLLVPIIVGWPAALLALTKLNVHAVTQSDVRLRLTDPPHATDDARLAPGFRWRIVPVVLALTVSCGLLGVAAMSGLASIASNTSTSRSSGQGGAGSARSWETKFQGGRMNLNSRGQLSQDPVAEVPALAPSHWRSATLDYYNGQGWQVTGTSSLHTTISSGTDGVRLTTDGNDTADGSSEASEAATPESPTPAPDVTKTSPNSTPTPTTKTPLMDPSPADPGAAPSLGINDEDTGALGGADTLELTAAQKGTLRSDQVVIRGSETAQLIAPGRLITAELPAGYAQRTFVSTGDRILLPGHNKDDYTVNTRVYPAIALPASLGTAAQDPVIDSSQSIDPRYLQIPDTLPLRVRDLGQQLVSAASTRLAAVQAVESRLGQLMSYTLNAPVPPTGQDAVDFALFDSHQGFCEHYASAEVMLLRSAGIPARMVVGYQAAGQEVLDNGRQLIRREQGHAWVEVWFPGAGWVTSDATPAGSIDQSFLESVNSAFNRSMSALADRGVAFVTGVVGPIVVIAMLLVAWLFRRALLRFGQRLFARRRAGGTEVEPPIDAGLRAAFFRLEAVLTTRGTERAENETLAALKDRVIGSRRYTAPAEKEELERAFDVLGRALYASKPPSEDECREAAAIFDQEAERQESQPVASLGQSAQLM
jgi:transglutaminase-like putative cysteine protease